MTQQHANWFIAFATTGLWYERAHATALPEELRFTYPSDLHMTVCFLGATGEARARDAWRVLEQRMEEDAPPAMRVGLGAVSPFGRAGRYAALAVELSSNREAAFNFIATYRPVIADAAGVKPDPRPPRPHITLARPLRKASQASLDAGLRWARSIDYSGDDLLLSRLSLYTWYEDRSAPRKYEIVDELRLR